MEYKTAEQHQEYFWLFHFTPLKMKKKHQQHNNKQDSES